MFVSNKRKEKKKCSVSMATWGSSPPDRAAPQPSESKEEAWERYVDRLTGATICQITGLGNRYNNIADSVPIGAS